MNEPVSPKPSSGTDVEESDSSLEDDLLSVGDIDGVAAIGICGVEPLTQSLKIIQQRKDAGLHGGMNFTYRNPVRSTDPRTGLPSAQSAIVVAHSYSPDTSEASEADSARVARYAAQDAYGRLREVLDLIRSKLTARGYRGTPVADSNALVDRAMAHRAGLGWIGKNTNLLVPGVGSWVVLGTVLTNAKLTESARDPLLQDPLLQDQLPQDQLHGQCGRCDRCLTECPTGALIEPGVLDAGRCLSWLLQIEGSFPVEFREALGDRIYGCDDCQEVCPPNRSAPEVRIELSSTGSRVNLDWLLTAGDEALMAEVGGWYIPNREPRYVRRNALVVLGNSGRSDKHAADLVRAYLESPDTMLVEHAAWAAGRLGMLEMLRLPDFRDHPAVKAELALRGPG